MDDSLSSSFLLLFSFSLVSISLFLFDPTLNPLFLHSFSFPLALVYFVFFLFLFTFLFSFFSLFSFFLYFLISIISSSWSAISLERRSRAPTLYDVLYQIFKWILKTNYLYCSSESTKHNITMVVPSQKRFDFLTAQLLKLCYMVGLI